MTRRTAEALREAVALLREAGIPDPARDARRLLAHALGIDASRLTLVLPDPLDPAAAMRFEHLIQRRVTREPVSHLTGMRSFYGRAFHVSAAVLDPRPETENLIAAALAEPFGTVLDLGTGSGAILLTLLAEDPQATGTGVDVSPEACAIARQNAAALGLSDRATLHVSDWTSAVTGRFDLIVSNPPYIAAAEMHALSPEVRDWEPQLALTDHGDGLNAYRAIFAQAAPYLAPQGRIIVEIGPTQAQSVARIAAGAGFVTAAPIPDLDGRDRVILARLAASNG